MHPFGERYPKPLLPICNKPLIQHHVETLKALGIDHILVVIGHLGFEIARLLGDGRALGVTIQYVEQRETLGIAHALGQLEPHVDRPFLMVLGDIFFVPNRLPEIFAIAKARSAACVLAAKHEPDLDAIRRNFAIVTREDGLVERVIEKPRYPPNRLKGCGIYLFDLQVFDAIRRTPRTAMRDEYELTNSIQILIDDGHPVAVAEVVARDVNLTYPADLLRCNLESLSLRGQTTLIGDGCELPLGVRIERSVIGDGVRVEHPIRIADAVVFPRTEISTKEDLCRVIVTPDGIVECPRPLGDEGRVGGQ
jgi:NDP-sugar pyrophosphorylase family protein